MSWILCRISINKYLCLIMNVKTMVQLRKISSHQEVDACCCVQYDDHAGS
jgi:hypothetical protein